MLPQSRPTPYKSNQAHVSMNPEEIVPEWVFACVPRLRHVSVESEIRLIGAEAWQDCQQLRIVKLPATVVGIADNAFRDCKLLNSVLAPGCRDFGHKAFSECCSLQSVYASDGAVNVFNGETNFEDSPHITHDGVLLHGRCAPQRATVYPILQQADCLSPHGWAVGRGQTSRTLASFAFSQMCRSRPSQAPTSARGADPHADYAGRGGTTHRGGSWWACQSSEPRECSICKASPSRKRKHLRV